MSNNSYFGFPAGGNQYGGGTGYGAGQQTGFGNTNQRYGQPMPQRPYGGYDQQQQYQQQLNQPNPRYEAADAQPSNYFTQGYNQPPEPPMYQSGISKGFGNNTPNYNTMRGSGGPPPPSSPKGYPGYVPPSPNYNPYPAQNMRFNNKPTPSQSPSTWTAPAAQPGFSGTAAPSNLRKVVIHKPGKPKAAPKPIMFQYCSVCKISCAGPQTYKEHLEGQKHKKKELAAQATATEDQTQAGKSRVHTHSAALRCELCDVVCTGSDAYAAHIRGAKHQKVVKLHTKLGKPIPSTDPVVLSKKNKKEGETESDSAKKTSPSETDVVEADVQPVGHEYIEELRNSDWKLISFQCKLCDCKFSDPNAKEMHMKGRKHRLQYKRKVNPDLVVDCKPSTRRIPLRPFREDFPFIPPGMEPRSPVPPPPMFMRMLVPPFLRPDSHENRHILAKHLKIYCPEKEMTKIREIVAYTEKALKGVSDLLASSDDTPKPIVEIEPKQTEAGVETESGKPEAEAGTQSGQPETSNSKNEDDVPPRQLRGVMKVGNLAKGLLLTGDTEVGLVVLSGDKPTKTLLNKVASLLPGQLEAAVDKEKEAKANSSSSVYPTFSVTPEVDEAAICIRTTNLEPSIGIKVTLTSPVMREKDEKNGTTVQSKADPADVLDKAKCLDALADLRHAKWFQACASGPQSCVLLVRIFRDICRRSPAWSNLEQWPLELLIENVMASAGMTLLPAEGFRRVMGAISSGILLPGSSYLIADPCEKQPTDVFANLKLQDREDITASAQLALRLIAFRQIHKVLGIEEIEHQERKSNRKRRFENKDDSAAEGEGKKDKKDDDEVEDITVQADVKDETKESVVTDVIVEEGVQQTG